MVNEKKLNVIEYGESFVFDWLLDFISARIKSNKCAESQKPSTKMVKWVPLLKRMWAEKMGLPRSYIDFRWLFTSWSSQFDIVHRQTRASTLHFSILYVGFVCENVKGRHWRHKILEITLFVSRFVSGFIIQLFCHFDVDRSRRMCFSSQCTSQW